jgi:hypothetical protein
MAWKTHGQTVGRTTTTTYNAWANMVQRCFNRRTQLMQLFDIICATVERIFRPPAPRLAARTVLVVPLHEAVDKKEMSPVLAKAAETLARSGLLWKWVSNGTAKLCSWDSSEKVFVRGTVEDWQIFIGQNWRVRDSSGVEYAGPSRLVADRLTAAVLAHPETPVASWQIATNKKREAARK